MFCKEADVRAKSYLSKCWAYIDPIGEPFAVCIGPQAFFNDAVVVAKIPSGIFCSGLNNRSCC